MGLENLKMLSLAEKASHFLELCNKESRCLCQRPKPKDLNDGKIAEFARARNKRPRANQIISNIMFSIGVSRSTWQCNNALPDITKMVLHAVFQSLLCDVNIKFST